MILHRKENDNQWIISATNFISDSPYGENLTAEQQMAYHMQMSGNPAGFEEPQTPTQNYGQMSFEDAIDGGHGQNSGSYNAGQQQRRIIREIIVWKKTTKKTEPAIK